MRTTQLLVLVAVACATLGCSGQSDNESDRQRLVLKALQEHRLALDELRTREHELQLREDQLRTREDDLRRREDAAEAHQRTLEMQRAAHDEKVRQETRELERRQAEVERLLRELAESVERHDSSRVVHVLIDGDRYAVRQMVDSESIYRPMPLSEVVARAKAAPGNPSGVRVCIQRLGSSLPSAEQALEEALLAAGLKAGHVRMVPAAQTWPTDGSRRGIISKTSNKVVDLYPALAENPNLKIVEQKAQGDDPVSFALRAYIDVRSRAKTVGMTRDVQLHRAEHQRWPAYDEFMRMMRQHGVQFTMIEPFRVYAYDSKTGEIVVLEDPDEKRRHYQAAGIPFDE